MPLRNIGRLAEKYPRAARLNPAGAWIETGLKESDTVSLFVAPLAGAWIETSISSRISHYQAVSFSLDIPPSSEQFPVVRIAPESNIKQILRGQVQFVEPNHCAVRLLKCTKHGFVS